MTVWYSRWNPQHFCSTLGKNYAIPPRLDVKQNPQASIYESLVIFLSKDYRLNLKHSSTIFFAFCDVPARDWLPGEGRPVIGWGTGDPGGSEGI